MRYRLRTLLIVLALGPPLLAGAFWHVQHHIRRQSARARLNAAWDIGMQEGIQVWRELIDSGQLD